MVDSKPRSISYVGDGAAQTTSAESSGHRSAAAEIDAEFLEQFAERRRMSDNRNIAAPDFTYRHNWGLMNGWWTLTLNGPFNARSNVFVSLSELSDMVSTTDPVQDPIMGSARFAVYNVVPLNGAVQVRVHIDWPTPLFLQVSYLVVRP